MFFWGGIVYLWYVLKSFIMRKLFVLAMVCFFVGCTSNTSNSVSTEGMSAKEIVEKDVFINMTSDDVMEQVKSRSMGPQTVSPSFRAAVYRFMKSVTYTDKAIGSSSAKCGADLNMSEDLFKHFIEEMEFINNEMRKADEKGNTVLSPVLGEAYFSKLLEE